MLSYQYRAFLVEEEDEKDEHIGSSSGGAADWADGVTSSEQSTCMSAARILRHPHRTMVVEETKEVGIGKNENNYDHIYDTAPARELQLEALCNKGKNTHNH